VADNDNIQIPEWMREIQQKADPNRVGSLQIPSAHPLERQTPVSQHLPATPAVATHLTPGRPTGPAAAALHDPTAEPSYYDVSPLKPPVWRWEVASYFFLGGVSGGAYLLSRIAERFGGNSYQDLAKAGAYVAAGALLPCPPLLIHDLGDPKRFHHMLRVWKPSSPMNVGTWTLTAYSGPAMLNVVHQWARSRSPRERSAIDQLLNPFVVAVSDAAGVPLSLMLIGYTGVLLSCTANPLWSKNPWLGPMFTSSAVSSGAAAIQLALHATGCDPDCPSIRALDHVDTAAHAAETLCMAGFVNHAGERAKPLMRGKRSQHFWLAGAAVAAAEVLKHLPLQNKRARRWAHIGSAALSLAAGFHARWALVHGGRQAARDPHLARIATGTESARTLPEAQAIANRPSPAPRPSFPQPGVSHGPSALPG
jgi:formate-dependent nitrite reductase membrane component NrfD